MLRTIHHLRPARALNAPHPKGQAMVSCSYRRAKHHSHTLQTPSNHISRHLHHSVRAYATYTELPASAETNRAPVPPKQPGRDRKATAASESTGSSHEAASYEATEDDITALFQQAEESDASIRDDEGNLPYIDPLQPHSRRVPPISQPASHTRDPSRSPPDSEAKEPTTKAKKARTKTKSSKSKKWQAYNQPKTFEQESFEEMRRRHRTAALAISYKPHPLDATSKLKDAGCIWTKPLPLTSRYDWRLRAPSRSTSQKAIYGGNIVWRKTEPVLSPDAAGLFEYQKHFLRFINLEREAAEDSALERLKKEVTRAQTRQSQQPLEIQDSLEGLHAKSPSNRSSSRHLVQPSILPSEATSAELDASDVEVPFESEQKTETEKSTENIHYFSLPRGEDLPTNKFTRGKMVFIWKSYWDDTHKMYRVPALEDPETTWQDLKPIPHRGWVKRAFANTLHINCEEGFVAEEGAAYRLDLGYDDTSFSRMEVAVKERLPNDASKQRQNNLSTLEAPHTSHRDIEICGTELRQMLLRDFADAPGATKKTAEKWALDSGSYPSVESELMYTDQRVASWARRYSRKNPIRMDGDPDLGLNHTQVLAVACAIRYRLMLIQGPPGTGKTQTIVETLSLLKKHFSVPHPILVCAHTNVAVDLLTAKCAEEGLVPLRFGSTARVRPNLHEHTYEHRMAVHHLQPVLQRLANEQSDIMERLDEIKHAPSRVEEGVNLYDQTDLVDKANEQAEDLQAEEEELQQRLKKVEIRIIKTHKRIQTNLIESSDVCLATCIGGNQWAMQTADFPMVFIDEAGQCDEPSSLVPLMKGSRHLVLIGDHKQLPSVVSNPVSQIEGLNISLFERLMRQDRVPSVMLDMQYRMLPSISAFPNRSFYHGNIRDSQERTASQEGSTKSPVVFIHHEGAEERSRHSILNVSEAEIIVQVVNKLVSEDRQDPASVGVISAYAAQAARLKVCMRKALGEAADMVEISTVDGFQGREKHTIILSTVRSNTTGTIGFLSDARRLNVALTRAQERLFVIGNHHTLSRIDIWRPKQHVYVDYLEWLQQNDMIRSWSDHQSSVALAEEVL